MSLKYLLDTNIISESMGLSPHPQVVNKLRINK
jgi:predicted nucleic acid-binding protein